MSACPNCEPTCPSCYVVRVERLRAALGQLSLIAKQALVEDDDAETVAPAEVMPTHVELDAPDPPMPYGVAALDRAGLEPVLLKCWGTRHTRRRT